MCGIFGSFGRSVDDGAVNDALAAMAHRGPDGTGWRRLGPDRLLGHTRLAIVDLTPEADQPMAGLDGRLMMVFNGEIYNAPELRAAIPDYPWTTDHSDSEAILAAYWRWGRDFVRHLRGMFAFALWDAAEEVLLLAVDRFSIKPLLIARDGKGLSFASTAGALRALGHPLSVDERAVHSWLADGVLDTGAHTFFAGVEQVPAASLAVFRDGALTVERYWQPPRPEEADLAPAEIEDWIEEALHGHLLSDVPVGVNLSSGLDSNVLRLMAKRGGHPLHAFTFSFPGTAYDEAARVAPAMGADDEWTRTPITADDLWRDLVTATRMLESPLGGVAIYGHMRNAAAARTAGCKVLLAGEGADETFAGYKYYAEAAIAERWRAGDRAGAAAMHAAFAARDPDAWTGSAERLAQASAEPPRAKAPDGTSLAGGFLTDAFAGAPKLPPVPPMVDGGMRDLMWRDLSHTKIPKLLRWQDRAYMASSVEIRVPFLDHPLVERLQAAPADMLLADGHGKAPLRKLAERLMPSAFFQQPKLYVATPQREWLKHDLRDRVEEMLDPGAALVRRGYVDLERLRHAYRAYCAEEALGNSFFIWKFLALEALFQGVIETDRPVHETAGLGVS